MTAELYGPGEDGGLRVSPSILDTPGYQRQIEGARRLAKMHNEQKETTEETAARMKASMTAETDLLPLPDAYMASEFVHNTFVYGANQMQAYARACVSSATEALRAEVRTLRRQQASWERHIAAAGCEYVLDEDGEVLVNRRAEQLDADMEALRAEVERLKELVRSVGYETLPRAEAAEARAERLAEALQGIETKLVHSMDHARSSLERKRAMSECADAARAALEQETTNG